MTGATNHLQAAVAHGRAVGARARTAVLVEGTSDQHALETLARRRGRDLDAEQIAVVPMGGATNIGHFLALLGPSGYDLRLAGLCDEGEVGEYRLGLQRAGLAGDLGPDDPDTGGMERLGFFVCVRDLEEELIRALGNAAVEQVVADEGELTSFRTFQKQPAQRGRPHTAQLRRFIGTRSGRKARYGRLLVEALDLARTPRPLDDLLAYV